jgi:antitoxin VapB
MLSIKDPTTDHLARELAKLTKESITEAVAIALRERLDRIRNTKKTELLVRDLMEIGQHCAAHATLDQRTPDEILGYDEHGLPS